MATTYTLPPIAPLQRGGQRDRATNLTYIWNIDTIAFVTGDTIQTPIIDPEEIEDGNAGKYVFPCEQVTLYKRLAAGAADGLALLMPTLTNTVLPLSIGLNHAFASDASNDSANTVAGAYLGIPFRGLMSVGANRTPGINALVLTLHRGPY